MTTNSNSKLYVASDLGNDSVKIAFFDSKQIKTDSPLKNSEQVKVPSVISRANSGQEKVRFDNKSEKDKYMHNFFNHIEASVSSSSVKTDYKFYLGQSAIDARNGMRRFDINNYSGKSEDDLSLILNLTLIAAKRVKDAYFNNEDLTKQLDTTVYLTTALPIREGQESGVIDSYQNKYLNSNHIVNFYNFNDVISVNLHFELAKSSLEGQVAQIAISNSPIFKRDLAQSLFDDLVKNYPKLKDIKPSQIVSVKNLLGVDIGGKTVDFPVIMDNRANTNVSRSSMKGYDSVLLNSVQKLQTLKRNFNDIGQLESYLEAGPNPFDPDSYKQVLDVIKSESSDLEEDIVNNISITLGSANLNPNLVFVYGGGSVPMLKDTNLRKEISDKLRSFNSGRDIPVVWVDKKYAQKLNLMGLEIWLIALVH